MTSLPQPPQPPSPPRATFAIRWGLRDPRGKLIVLAALLAIAAVAAWQFRDLISLDALVQRERRLRDLQAEHSWLLFGLGFVVYTAVCGLSIPGGATALTLLFGWLFGFWRAVLLVSFASTAGATLAFLMSRYLLRDYVQSRFANRLGRVRAAFDRDGILFLFCMRLSPVVPFFAINVVMGLTSIRARTFWWVSQLGMLPATCIYISVASSISLAKLAETGGRGILTPRIILGLSLLGAFPLVVRKLVGRRLRDDS
jgi:uncharacterized membrane protein YdjX (TVP38/TMEM64 family)